MNATALKLKENNIIRYSPMEKKIFAVLRRSTGKFVKTDRLCDVVYNELNREKPASARLSITAAVRSLSEKLVKNDEPWKVTKTTGAGPYSTEVKIEER